MYTYWQNHFINYSVLRINNRFQHMFRLNRVWFSLARLKKRSNCSLQYGVTDIRVVDGSIWVNWRYTKWLGRCGSKFLLASGGNTIGSFWKPCHFVPLIPHTVECSTINIDDYEQFPPLGKEEFTSTPAKSFSVPSVDPDNVWILTHGAWMWCSRSWCSYQQGHWQQDTQTW
jgi:hypothetical protein